MKDSSSITRWRDKSVIPSDYTDVAGLVKVARKARGCAVEFEWVFSREDLERLRRAVFEWGSGVVGRYRCFDSRVLAAINSALGETNSIFVLSEPKNGQWADSQVSCVAEGEEFRLRGHAPFDIIFGYGSVKPGTAASLNLGPTAHETLAEAVVTLGWDVQRLQEERLRPVHNALYGVALNHGCDVKITPSGPTREVDVRFHGPFSALDDGSTTCLFGHEIARRTGVYLWTFEVDGTHYAWYVGQTQRRFDLRMGEHFRAMLSGEYPTFDEAALARGEPRLVEGAATGWWPGTLPAFLKNYESLAPHIIGLIRRIRVHLAPLAGDDHLLNRVEGAIGRLYKAHPDSRIRGFFSPGIKVPAAIPFDKPVLLRVSSASPIAGLPAELPE